MIDYPKLGIVLLTYKRKKEALLTIRGVINKLGYEKALRGWYVADDGSEAGYLEALLAELKKKGEHVIGSHSERFSPKTGIGWNKGLGIAHQFSDFVLVLEDDWVLKRKLDIHPFIEMLVERDDVGMVRLGGLAVGNNVELIGHNGHHYLKYYKDRQYAYSGNPHLRHARFTKRYGWFSEEEKNPGELELEFDGRVRAMDGPQIWRPADIPGYGVFDHIGTIRYRE